MKKLYVFADFDWLKEPRLVGELSYESLRGSDSYGFMPCIGNTDDHFRNHGFILTAKGWTLSPAYDMNPTLSEYQSLQINSYTNKSDLKELLDSCEEYMLPKKIAEQIIIEVLNAVRDWRALATRLTILKGEQERFAAVFERHMLSYDRNIEK